MPISKCVDLEIPELPHKNDVTDPTKWPARHAWMLKELVAPGSKWRAHDQADVGTTDPRASPRFYLSHDRRLIAAGAGKNGWNYRILPALRSILSVGTCPGSVPTLSPPVVPPRPSGPLIS